MGVLQVRGARIISFDDPMDHGFYVTLPELVIASGPELDVVLIPRQPSKVFFVRREESTGALLLKQLDLPTNTATKILELFSYYAQRKALAADLPSKDGTHIYYSTNALSKANGHPSLCAKPAPDRPSSRPAAQTALGSTQTVAFCPPDRLDGKP